MFSRTQCCTSKLISGSGLRRRERGATESKILIIVAIPIRPLRQCTLEGRLAHDRRAKVRRPTFGRNYH